MKHHSKSVIDHPFSLQSVCSSIEYTKLDNTIQREGLYWHAGKKISTARMKNSTDGVCVFFQSMRVWGFLSLSSLYGPESQLGCENLFLMREKKETESNVGWYSLDTPSSSEFYGPPLSKIFGEIFHLKFHDFFGQLVNMKLQRRQIVVENWKKEGYVSAPLKAAEPP